MSHVEVNNAPWDTRPFPAYPVTRHPIDETSAFGLPRREYTGLSTSPRSKTLHDEPSQDGLLNMFVEQSRNNGESFSSQYERRMRSQYAAIQEYLVDDPELYVPSSSALDRFKDTAICHIDCAVRSFLEAVGPNQGTCSESYSATNYEKTPNLYGVLSSPSFFDICKRVYGASTVESLYEKSLQSYVSMKDFLSALLAASITDWVFDGRHDSLPRKLTCKTEISRVYEGQVALRMRPIPYQKNIH